LPSAGPIAQEKRDSVAFPDIPGYQTLKGDFHLHTVFSDGQVWPSFRVHEAKRDGLDFIALTDHVDYQGHPNELPKDYNKPYELAVDAAKGSGLLVIRGVEISPRTPPYHNGAIFLEDANAIPSGYMADEAGRFVMKPNPTHDELIAPFLAVAKQGAFVIYNHPGYLYDWDHEKMGVDLMTPIHKELLEKGILKGIEVVNSIRYYKKAHRLAMKYGLTMIASSDEHEDIAGRYRDVHTPMTLVFARERTVAGIKDALLDRRTVAYYKDFLIGRTRELEPLFKASIEVTTSEGNHNVEPLLLLHFRNRSDFPYHVRLRSAEYDFDTLPLGQVVLPPHETTTVALETLWDFPSQLSLQLDVENVLTGPDEYLHTSLVIRPSWQHAR
jgi:predicted metal-dependent phosphoesterase TrpH